MKIRATKEQINERKHRYHNLVKGMWMLFVLGVISVAALFAILSQSDLPTLEDLEDQIPETASQIYSSDGNVLGRFYVENRVPVKFRDLNKAVVSALIATEDERFFEHCGIDWKGLLRATVYLGTNGGASTISQQLAKLYFTGRRSKKVGNALVQKLKEWIIALRLERQYTKEEIIAKYLNKFDFLYSGHGIRAASETYFGKDQRNLNIEEAAMLVGMLKNPSLYNPKKYPERATNRRTVVLGQMLRNDKISRAAYDSLKLVDLDISSFKRRNHNDGLAQYFRVQLGKKVRVILSDENYFNPSTGQAYDMYRDGLRIYTTIDSRMQNLAEKEMIKHMKDQQKKFVRHWRNKNPWEFVEIDEDDMSPDKTRSRELDIRAETLKRYVRRSDRYQVMRDRIMKKSIEAIKIKVEGLRTRNADIERMLGEEGEPGLLTRLRRAGRFGKEMQRQYETALRTPEWKDLKSDWLRLQRTVEKSFNEPVKMSVFTYENLEMEKDSVMSPMDSILYHNSFLQFGSMAVDPHTGEVKMWIGGINHKYFQYDHVTSSRQVGSTFKPFIYSTALGLQGFSPCFQVLDQAYTIFPGEGAFNLIDEWTPKNSDNEYSGEKFTLKDALRKSKNTVSVYLMKQLGDTEPIRGLIHNMGIDSTLRYGNGRYRVPKQPSICLGATDLTVWEMTGAYTTFANNGIYTEPTFITRIEDSNGGLIYASNPVTRDAFNERDNYVMMEMLKYAGSNGLHKLKSEVGGKTGTTNSHVDGWFMGLTPNLVVGTWVGGEDRWIRFRTIDLGQGARMAKPFFRDFMLSVEKDSILAFDPKARFFKPPGDMGVELDCNLYVQDELIEGIEDRPSDFGDEILPINQDSTSKKPIAEQGFGDDDL